jgi:hypothetical protein
MVRSLPTGPTVDSWMNRERIEDWWPLVARILMFLVGAGVFVQQATVPNPPGAQESLIAASLGLMGPLAAKLVAEGIEKTRNGNGKEPT